MTLKAVISAEEHGALNEAIQPEYVEKDGMYFLDAEAVKVGNSLYSLEDVSGLKSALSKERKASEDAKRMLAAYEGVDVDEAKTALDKVKEMSSWTPEQKVQELIEQKEKKLSKEYGAQIQAKEELLKTRTVQLDNLLKTTAATQALLASDGDDKTVKLMLPHILNQLVIREKDDGSRHLRIIDEDGTDRMSLESGNTGHMDVKELAKQMKQSEDFASAWPGSGARGTGITGSTGSGSAYTISRVDARDPVKYQAAKAAAEKAGKTLQMTE